MNQVAAFGVFVLGIVTVLFFVLGIFSTAFFIAAYVTGLPTITLAFLLAVAGWENHRKDHQ